MRNEDLKALELTDEQVAAVQKLNGLDISKEREKFEVLKQEKEAAEQAKVDLENQIEELKNTEFSKEDFEKLKEERELLETKISELEESHSSELTKVQMDLLLKSELKSAGVINDKALNFVLAEIQKLEEGSIKLNEGKLEGLDDVVKNFKEDEVISLFFNKEDKSTKPPVIQNFSDKTNSNGGDTKVTAFDAIRSKYE